MVDGVREPRPQPHAFVTVGWVFQVARSTISCV
jgi:hypothetical protein